MADFVLDFRPTPHRCLEKAASALKFHAAARSFVFETADFGLVLTFAGADALWQPHRTEDGSLFAVVGFVALEESEWKKAELERGFGGLAGKAVAVRYREQGMCGLESVPGNAAILVYDHPLRRLVLVTDIAGALPVFRCESNGAQLIGSHPDVLALQAGCERDLDEVSLAEFVLASTVTPPFTFYRAMRAVPQATRVSFDFIRGTQASSCYWELAFRGDRTTGEDALAHDLAQALRSAIQRRSLPRLGKVAIALSGGLDSRLLAACLSERADAFAFTCFDQPNPELRTAEALAASLNLPFQALRRSDDYYAENAEAGVRISGGMGTFANNHFHGVMATLHKAGMEVMLTGCYCDYLFKGLALNRKVHWLTGKEVLGDFSTQFYFECWVPRTELAEAARRRWEQRWPASARNNTSDEAIFQLEASRTFPLCYEGDNQQRVVPQRLTGWFPPVVDHGVLNVYRRIPWGMKLNRSIFLKAAQLLLRDSPAAKIADANTGSRLTAGPLEELLSYSWKRLKGKWRRLTHSVATEGSWPNWSAYVRRSQKLDELWKRPHALSDEFMRRLMGWEKVPIGASGFKESEVFLFVALLNTKVWLEQRTAP